MKTAVVRTRSDWQKVLASPPQWVWDSAAPYFSYIQAQEDNNRFYWGCRLAVTAAAAEIKTGTFPWQQVGYEMSHYPWNQERTFDPDRKTILLGLAEAAIVREGSAFDMFLACWMWNMMLSLLEKGDEPRPEHEETFRTIVTEHKVPSRGSMLRCFGDVGPVLKAAPHHETGPRPSRRYRFPPTDAWNAIHLWHQVRHRIVHMDSVVDATFLSDATLIDTWRRICEEKRAPTGLVEGQRFPLGNKHVTACLANYKTAAKALRLLLIGFSGEKRGHSDAPNAFKNWKKRSPGTIVEVPGLFLKTKTTIVVR